ncbi:hypothetical protein [Melittangium boletus]|uniref:hypothetical protein n=1 Tax=Melittangium boletus TaxID=83453 RepID=UPI003DA478A2
MSRPPFLRCLPLLLCLLSGLPARQAHAQHFHDPSMLDPEEMAMPDDPESDDSGDEEQDDSATAKGKNAKGAKGAKGDVSPAEAKGGKNAKGEPVPEPAVVPAAPPPVVRPPPAPILSPRITDADLAAAWTRWRTAVESMDKDGAAKAQAELVALKQEVGAMDIDAFSMALIRAAEGRRKGHDEAGALRLVEEAAIISPNLPYVRLALAQAYAERDPTGVGAYTRELKAAATALLRDPRYRRPALADLGTAVLVALMATTVVVVGVLFLRRVRYLLHDFHHLFPRGTARWQSTALAALLLLGTPLAMRWGLVPVLLIALASVAFYLTRTERAVAAVLIALTALVPLAAGRLAQSAAFAGTVAEDIYVLERGGFDAEPVAERVRERHEKKQAGFAELFALGRFEARRGQLPEALVHYKAAANSRPSHAALMTNLGNALLASGDEDSAARLYIEAMSADPSLVAPPFNLAEVYRRRAAVAPDSEISAQNQRASEALATAARLDPVLLRDWNRPPDDRLLMNRLLLSPPLPRADLPTIEEPVVAQRVEEQLSRRLLGRTGFVAWGLALLGTLGAFGLGFAAQTMKTSRECEKCGRPVCRRCDKELGVASKTCAQCVNVFSRRVVVEARVRARKHIEIERNRRWGSRLSYVLGALVSGAGHVFHGFALRGALYAFLFLLAVAGVLLRSGVFRAPYGEVPLVFKLAPVLLFLIPLHLLTLRGLYRRQNE